MSLAFGRLATELASTRRASVSGGKRAAPSVYLTEVACTPLDPVSAELRRRAGLDTPHAVLETFVDADLDIRSGDVLVVGGEDYPVRAVAEWAWRGRVYLHLLVEDLRR